MVELVGRESSWNPQADNPTSTAYGYGQFLDATRADYKKKFPNLDYNNPTHQLILMMHYVKDRYGDPYKALVFWDKNNWY
jgi:SLT domain-containing protein